MGDWLFQRSRIEQRERVSALLLRRAFQDARSTRMPTFLERQLIEGRGDAAVNPAARVDLGRALCREFEELFDLGPERTYPDERLFFCTLCDRECSTPHDETSVPVAKFIRQLRKGLKGLSYVGFLEPAYYTNITHGAAYKGKRAIFWHIHAICWGSTSERMKSRFDQLNSSGTNYRPIAEGLIGAHEKPIPRRRMADYFWYPIKAPKDSYRIYQASPERIYDDGVVSCRFQQKSQKLRPGERITLFHALRGIQLDDLALAGGGGVDILRRARRRWSKTKAHERFKGGTSPRLFQHVKR